MVEYRRSKRGVREQVLNLSIQEKYKIIQLLEENYKPENRKYKYEFFYDNCSSRLRDIIKKVFKENISFYQSPKSNKFTFRETIHMYLKSFPWLKLGIDLVLGNKIDVLVSNENLMFLPLNVEQIFDQSLVQNNKSNKNLIKSKNTSSTRDSTLEAAAPAVRGAGGGGWRVDGKSEDLAGRRCR